MKYVYINNEKNFLLIILKKKNLLNNWISKKVLKIIDYYFDYNEREWINNDLSLKWLKNCFKLITHEKMREKTCIIITMCIYLISYC